jgi:ADP-ribose pyrophosphatase
MGYLSDLRKVVGHRRLVIAFSVMIVMDETKRVLLEERADDGYWDFPGGSVELDETVEAAALRELQEETGLVGIEYDLLKVYSGDVAFYRYANGDEVCGVDTVYVCTKYQGTLKAQDDEVKRLKWFSLNDVPEKLSPRNRLIVEDLKKKYC